MKSHHKFSLDIIQPTLPFIPFPPSKSHTILNQSSMASFTNTHLNPLKTPQNTTLSNFPTLPFSSFSFALSPKNPHSFPTLATKSSYSSPKASAATPKASEAAAFETKPGDRVKQVHSAEEFDDALKAAKNKLVVVEYAASHSQHSSKIYPFMVELSRTCNDVEFLLIMGDESQATRDLCRREKVEKVPHFSFYKSMEKIHEEEAIGPDQLMGDVLYYGDNHSGVEQLHSKEDVERLIDEHRGDGKLLVLDVGLKHCGPCVKVYPTVIKLSRQMETVVFARMNGDENESCMEFLKGMNVIEVPTFLFIRDGEICGRYVGSGKGELIGEILRYQGVRVTY